MAESGLYAQYSQFQERAAMEMSWDLDTANWPANNTNIFAEALRAGMRQFLHPPALPNERQPHRWGFLRRSASVSGIADRQYTVDSGSEQFNYSLETSGLLTMADGQDDIDTSFGFIRGGVYFQFDDNANLPDARWKSTDDFDITTTYLTGFSGLGQALTVKQVLYPLPDDYGGIAPDGLSFDRKDPNTPRIKVVSEQSIGELDDGLSLSTHPEYASITPFVADDETTGLPTVRHWIRFFPRLKAGSSVNISYYMTPNNIDAAVQVFHSGGPVHSECVMASFIDKLHEIVRKSDEKHGYFLECLAASVQSDRRRFATATRGKMSLTEGGVYSEADMEEVLRVRRTFSSYDNMNLNFGGP